MLRPGSSVSPVIENVSASPHRENEKVKVKLTALVVLLHNRLDRAGLGVGDGLVGERGALGAHAARGVHGLLQGVGLPAEDVVTVLAVTCSHMSR